jgi:hypothetical protein
VGVSTIVKEWGVVDAPGPDGKWPPAFALKAWRNAERGQPTAWVVWYFQEFCGPAEGSPSESAMMVFL